MTPSGLLAGCGVAVVTALAAASPPPASAQSGEARSTWLMVKEVTATSELATKKGTFSAWQAVDFDEGATAWCEGKPDDGIGESLTIRFQGPEPISRVTAYGGRLGGARGAADGVPARLAFSASDGQKKEVELAPGAGSAEVELSGDPVESISIAVAAGGASKTRENCISRIEIGRANAPVVPVAGVVQLALADLAEYLRETGRAFRACDAEKIAERVRFPLVFAQASEAPNGKTYKATFKDAAALVKACQKKGRLPWIAEGSDVDTFPFGPTRPGRQPGQVAVDVLRAQLSQYWHLEWKEGGWWLVEVTP